MAVSKLNDVIHSVVDSGKFGENCSFVDLELSDVKGEDHFASEVVFARVKIKKGPNVENVDVIIKSQQANAYVREMMNTDAQFYNEVLMYNDILPFMEKNNILENTFPKLIYGCATLGENYEKDIMIVEDLRQRGYKLTTEKLFLDFDHCSLALKKLGYFHALSYSMKHENLELFFKKIGKLKEVRWEKEDKDETNRFLSVSTERGVLPLLEEGDLDAPLQRFMKNLQDPFKFMQELVRPEEPIAVLCHGDFCRNNMVFQYDDAGKPVDVRFFDVATARYASPTIDLSFFLFMNTSAELRDSHWDDMLKVYHDGLSSAIPGCRVPSLDIVRLEVSRKAAYGYVLCSFFIPMMMDFDSKTELEDFSKMKPEQIDTLSRTRGGDQATRYITDLVRHLVKINSL